NLTCKNWQIEAPFRMIQNNLDPDVAENPELPYWSAVTLASKGNLEQALSIFREVFHKEPRLRILTPRLVDAGLLPNDPALIEAIIQIDLK
ncbi:MAG TPA: hypothetical protein QGF51_06775, partial [Candidatus Marinimicrobia bacterium]|nr:hypothetical protein [Candidatus Neomarinimicrobiota bacterium]